MSNLLILIFAGLICVNYRKTIMLLAPLQFLLVMFKMEGNSVSPFEFISVIAVVFFVVKENVRIVKIIRNYPFKTCICLMLISVVGTNYLIEAHWPTATLNLCSVYIFPIVLFFSIKDKKDFLFLVNVMTIFSLIMGVYIVFEAITSYNPFIHTLMSKDWVNDSVYEISEVRFGIKRCQGFFSTSAGSGVFLGIYAAVFYEISKSFDKYKVFRMVIVCLFCFCALASGTRSAIAGVFIAWFIIIRKELFNVRFILIKLASVMFAIYFLGSFFLAIIDSFVNTENVSGSSTDLRMVQLMIVLRFWQNSPIWGNGLGFIWHFVKEVDAEILGAEGIWFQILVDYGLVGAIAYLSCTINMAVALWKKHKIWILIPVGFICSKTLSTIIGVEMSLSFVFAIMLLKYNEFCEVKNDESLQIEKDNE